MPDTKTRPSKGKAKNPVAINLWRCEKGHYTSNPSPAPGCGNGPPFICSYPCLAPCAGPLSATVERGA